MDNELIFSTILDKKKVNSCEIDAMQNSVYYDVNNITAFMGQLDLTNCKPINLNDTNDKLMCKVQDLSIDISKLKETFDGELNDVTKKLIDQIEVLNKQLELKTSQNYEINSCLIKQTTFCENLTELLKNSEQKNKDLVGALGN
jgi:hypothetical protein